MMKLGMRRVVANLAVTASTRSRVSFGPFSAGTAFVGVLLHYFTSAAPAAGESLSVRVCVGSKPADSAGTVDSQRSLLANAPVKVSKDDASVVIPCPFEATQDELFLTVDIEESDGDTYTAMVGLLPADVVFGK